MLKLTIDNLDVEVPAGATLLQAAQQLGIAIPTLCYRDDYVAQTSCMVCVVRVNGSDRLVPSCATRAEDGMVVESETESVLVARRMALELLLGDHVGDCLAPCQLACPAHVNIPDILRLITGGQMQDAISLIRERMPFPAILGRICPALCERPCRRKQLDSPVAVKLLERHVGDRVQESDSPLPACEPATGKTVAVVGAGPAGLSAAYYLLVQGHGCTLFDAHEQLGGGLRYGVSPEILPAEVLDGEIGVVVRLGSDIRLSTRLGADVSLDDLRREFDAVVLCVGEVTADAASAVGLPFSERSLQTDSDTHMTPVPGVFAAGSARSPSQHAVRAVAGGRGAALAVSDWLAGRPIAPGGRPYSVHRGRMSDEQMATFAAHTPDHDRVALEGGMAKGLSRSEAVREAERCLYCDCAGLAKCRLRRYAMQYQASATRYAGTARSCERVFTHPELVYEPGKCISCGLCVQIAAKAGEPLGLTFMGRGFAMAVGVPFSESLATAMKKSARECAQACPTGALVRRADVLDGDAPGMSASMNPRISGSDS